MSHLPFSRSTLVAWVAYVLAATLWTVGPAYAQPLAELTGTVSDATGLPLVAVTITLRGTGRTIGVTDVHGRFEFQDLREGDYELVASLAGFVPARRTLRLTAGERATLSLTLPVQLLQQTVVTAAKTGETDVQTTPMAISVVGGTELTRVDAHHIAHVAALAPSVTLSQNTDFAQLTIRGIGTNAVFAGSDPSSAVYLDGVYLARPAMDLVDFLEIDRIEVLRGPQGTLYGRNAVGGALNLVTKLPTDDFEASARIVAGSYDTVRSEARVSGPLARGRVMGSAAFLRGVRQGYVRDVDHPDHLLGGEDVTAARGQLRIVFNPRSDLLMSADVNHRDPNPLTWAKVLAVKPGFESRVDNPADPREVRTSTVAEGRNLQYGASARLRVDLTPSMQLASLTAFRKLDYDRLVDTDITELELNATRIHEIQHQVSEEITLAGRNPRLSWVGGLFLFDEVDRQPTSIRMQQANRMNLLDPRVDATSAAAFGQATAALTSRVSATAGLRYTHERKTIDNAGRIDTLSPAGTPVPGSAYAYSDTVTASPWTPKFGVETRIGHDMFAYVSATRGFKTGGFNLTSTEIGRGYAPEWAWSYEGGLKSSIGDGRATLNVSAFHTNYTDLQVSAGIRPGVIDISNAASATIRGVEVEGTARLARALRAGGHAAWLDATYDRYIAVATGGVTADVAGRRLNNAPEWSGRVWLDWTHAVASTRSVSLIVDSTWQSTVFFTPFNDVIQRQRPYGLLTISGEFGPHTRRWSVSAYARNLTNENYITGTFGTPLPAIGGRPGEPREVGVQFAVRR